jgi:hypothetical protein
MTTPVYELDPAEVQVGAANGPGLYIAPEGTPGPADCASPWPEPWAILGYLSDDGPTVGSSTDHEDIKPWQSLSPIRSVITGRSLTLQFIMWQLNEQTLGVYFDSPPAVPGVDGLVKMQVRTDTPQQLYALGLDTSDGDRAMRVIYHRASLSDAGDMQLQRGSVVPLDVTLTALDDAGVLADILLGPSGSGAPPVNVITVTNPGAQTSPVGVDIAPLQIVASGGPALTYAATGLPSGLAIAAGTGVITGIPDTAETANVSVTATDSTMASGNTQFAWTVE